MTVSELIHKLHDAMLECGAGSHVVGVGGFDGDAFVWALRRLDVSEEWVSGVEVRVTPHEFDGDLELEIKVFATGWKGEEREYQFSYLRGCLYATSENIKSGSTNWLLEFQKAIENTWLELPALIEKAPHTHRKLLTLKEDLRRLGLLRE
ncbi:MAG: hypothetical protein Q8R36_03995 [bacterium]|nr:hypothetical protein [bacterium]